MEAPEEGTGLLPLTASRWRWFGSFRARFGCRILEHVLGTDCQVFARALADAAGHSWRSALVVGRFLKSRKRDAGLRQTKKVVGLHVRPLWNHSWAAFGTAQARGAPPVAGGSLWWAWLIGVQDEIHMDRSDTPSTEWIACSWFCWWLFSWVVDFSVRSCTVPWRQEES